MEINEIAHLKGYLISKSGYNSLEGQAIIDGDTAQAPMNGNCGDSLVDWGKTTMHGFICIGSKYQ